MSLVLEANNLTIVTEGPQVILYFCSTSRLQETACHLQDLTGSFHGAVGEGQGLVSQSVESAAGEERLAVGGGREREKKRERGAGERGGGHEQMIKSHVKHKKQAEG